MLNHLKTSHTRADSVQHFKDLTRKDASTALGMELNKMIHTVPENQKEKLEEQLDAFHDIFTRYLSEAESAIEWDKIQLLADEKVKSYNDLPDVDPSTVKSALDTLVIVKLNGGLGTTMGCTGPKSMISVRDELTFLDLSMEQVENMNLKYSTSVPLVLMNSFNTEEDTDKVLRKYSLFKSDIRQFTQSMYPRINKETLLPVSSQLPKKTEGSRHMEYWYPPGHGDFYRSFYKSGLLDEYLKKGKEWVFLSNIDNLGASIDTKILTFLYERRNETDCPEFVMEVTDKTRADIKGGTLIEYENKLRLLEISQVPKSHKEDFASIRYFKIFNTNNLWINLKAMKRILDNDSLHMDLIVNAKTMDNGTNVIQLEEASGAAIKCFNHALGINVPRKRFLPVKNTSDLLLVMSNIYKMHSGDLIMSSDRSFPSTPLVKLGSHFSRVHDFQMRLESIPNVIDLDHLTVSGDVHFGKGVILRGTVIIIANHGNRIDIPDGSILENKIVSGNLHILNH